MAAPESWERVLVVNEAVEAALSEERFKGRVNDASSPRLRRIRSAAWAPSLAFTRQLQGGESTSTATLLDHGNKYADNMVNGNFSTADNAMVTLSTERRFLLPTPITLLGVTNDCGDFYILKVSSPFMNASNTWDAGLIEMGSFPTHDTIISNIPPGTSSDDLVSFTILEHQATEDVKDSRAHNTRPSLLAIMLSKKNFIEGIVWSPWKIEDPTGCKKSILTLNRGGVLFDIELTITLERGSIQCSFSLLQTKKRALAEKTRLLPLWLQEVSLPWLGRLG